MLKTAHEEIHIYLLKGIIDHGSKLINNNNNNNIIVSLSTTTTVQI